ncbi:TraR/DksA C4-type zinc finger protein [Sandarakinorhabdus sp.]|uniref:TraR/DksA family transcriptional regulator n=1 Tax=Sandarakinorhabdus sp. TaxID=1916663 RepID=UPI00333F47C5
MNTDIIATSLRARLAEVQADIARLEQATTQALPAKFADQASDLAQLATDEGREVQQIHEAEHILAALARIEAGTYGICSNCGCDIAPARLAALPTATQCINCAA